MFSQLADVRGACAADVAALHAIRSARELWLADIGVEQWNFGEVSTEDISAQVRASEWFVGIDTAGRVLGGLRYLTADSAVWRDNPIAEARYVHGLMTDRHTAAAGTGALLLSWAEGRGVSDGAKLMRLDCVESNRRLRGFYRRQAIARSVVGTSTARGSARLCSRRP